MGMGQTAENVAEKYQITRAEQEKFAVASQKKAAEARTAGSSGRRDRADPHQGGRRDRGRLIRPDTTEEVLSGLKPAFDKDGTVTRAPLRR